MFVQYSNIYDKEIRKMLEHTAYSLNWGKNAMATVVALDERNIVGLGSIDRNTSHPYRDYIRIYVKSNYRRKGIGKKLIQQLFNVSGTHKLQASVQSKDSEANAFLRNCGFQRVRKCYTPVLKRAKVSGSKARYDESATITFKKANETYKSRLLELHLRNYREFYKQINPLNHSMTIEQWKEIVLADLNTDQSKLLIVEEEVAAYILCYETDDSKEIEIGYIGGKSLQHIENYDSFFKKTIEQLITQFETVSIEADDVEPYAFGALNGFEYETDLSLDTYIL